MTTIESTTAAQNIRTRIQNLAAEVATFDEHRADEFAASKWKELREAIQLCKDMGIDIGDLLDSDPQGFAHFHVIGTV